jgi:hypothetical protein
MTHRGPWQDFNPYLAHLGSPRRRGYAGSEVSTSYSMTGTSSLVNGSNVGGGSGVGGVHGVGGMGVRGGYNVQPTLLSPIPQRITSTTFSLDDEDGEQHRPQPSEANAHPPRREVTTSTTSTSASMTSTNSPLRRFIRHLQTSLHMSTSNIISIITTILFTAKWIIGLGGYSGQASPPRYGDFEAQRFWMDLTIHHRPVGRSRRLESGPGSTSASMSGSRPGWYEVGGVEDGDWWRLDCEFRLLPPEVLLIPAVDIVYSLDVDPPLTAYISWVFGKM